MFAGTLSALSLSLVLGSASAVANAEVTTAAQLAPRQAGSNFVGYISENGRYTDARSCDYPQTVSTSGAYVQCCPTTGSCPFFTSCSSNTLLAAGATVPCDVNSALTCNTAIVIPTVGGNAGASYLACWQTSLGRSPFTFVQNVGAAAATGSATSTGAAASGSTARSSSTASQTSSASSSAASAASAASSSASSAASGAASTSRNNGNHVADKAGFGSGILGGITAFILQAVL